MNEQTNQLIRDLAEKLGTTSEYLWQVLVKQAPISGAANLIAIAIWIAVLVWSWKLIVRKTTVPPKTESNAYPDADWADDNGFVAWLIWGLFALACVLVTGVNAEMIVASLLNPEYWALKQILK